MIRRTTLAAAMLALGGAASADTQLVYGSWAPSTDPASIAMEAFVAEVAERSGGAVTIETHFDSSVVGMRTVLAAIGDNLVDAAYIAGSVYQAELPIESMATIYSSIQGNPWSMSAAMTELMIQDCADCATQYEEFEVTPLAYGATPHFYLMCRDPIENFEDLAGKSIRAASGNLSFPAMIDAVAVSTPTTDVFEAMQRGQVECAMGSVFWLQAYSLWDVVEYVLELPVGQYNNGLIFGVNTGLWDDMPKEDRDAILASLPTFVAEIAAVGAAKADEVKALSIEKGVQWAQPTPEMEAVMSEWFASKRVETEEWGTERGIANAAEILDTMEALVAKWNDKVEGLNNDKAAYREMLVSEIYSELGR